MATVGDATVRDGILRFRCTELLYPSVVYYRKGVSREILSGVIFFHWKRGIVIFFFPAPAGSILAICEAIDR